MYLRINKYLASLGVASRRKIDSLITLGRIKVNNTSAILGQKIDPHTDQISLDSHPLNQLPTKLVYLILNKPKFVLTTTTDDRGRPTVLDYVKSDLRLFPVGRLDYQSTGLVLLTNDGELANLITHPKYHLPKTYLVTTDSHITSNIVAKLTSGISLDNQLLASAIVTVKGRCQSITTLKITLFQGKKRQIRRMFDVFSLNLLSLHRIAIGPISLGTLKFGQSRSLTSPEIQSLKRSLSRLIYNRS